MGRHRKGFLTRHHLTPKCRFNPAYNPAIDAPENILRMYRDKHTAWHTVFKEATIEEAIALLQRVVRIKGRAA